MPSQIDSLHWIKKQNWIVYICKTQIYKEMSGASISSIHVFINFGTLGLIFQAGLQFRIFS